MKIKVNISHYYNNIIEFREKYEKININMSTANEKMNEELNRLKEKIIYYDTEIYSLNQEVERLTKQKSELTSESNQF